MKKLYKACSRIESKSEKANHLFLLLWTLINALIGDLLWVSFGHMVLPGFSWLICFIGYPAVFTGFVGGLLFLYRHDLA